MSGPSIPALSGWRTRQSRSHLPLSVSGSKLRLGDMTVDRPRSLNLGKGGVGVHARVEGGQRWKFPDMGSLMAGGQAG